MLLMIFKTLGGRKFILTIGAGIVCSILVWFGKITSGDFALIIIGTVAAFITGNTIEATKGGNNDNQQ